MKDIPILFNAPMVSLLLEKSSLDVVAMMGDE